MTSHLTASRKALTFLTAAFILHNAEEAFTMPQQTVSPDSIIPLPTYSEFLLAVSLLTIAVVAAYLLAMKTKRQRLFLFISATLSVSMLFNAFIPHISAAIYTLQYTPGLVTAVLLNLPLSSLVIARIKPLFLNTRQMTTIMAYGFATGYALFAVTMAIARLLV